MKPRRSRSDSVQAATRIASAAGSNLVPPVHVQMQDADWPFWRSVVAEYAQSDWSDHQLEVAAFLARTMADFESEQRLLRSEGAVAKSEKGTPVVNPRKAVVQMLAGSILSLRRSLSLHARAQAGEARDVAKRRVAGKQTQADARAGDDLIARPGPAK